LQLADAFLCHKNTLKARLRIPLQEAYNSTPYAVAVIEGPPCGEEKGRKGMEGEMVEIE